MFEISDQFDFIIKKQHGIYLSNTPFSWYMLKAQVVAESNLDPSAVSTVGAKGLMQLMPETFKEMMEKLFPEVPFDDHSIFDIRLNIICGAYYLSHLYKKFSEIKSNTEKYKFALASYNAGRGNINKMLSYARKDEGLPYEYQKWVAAGSPSGDWQKWNNAKSYLYDVTGKHSKETVYYVDKITSLYYKLGGK